MTTEQLDLLRVSLDARGAGHRLPVLATGDLSAYWHDASEFRPPWATEGLPAAWWSFHCDHPEVELALLRLARRLLRRGHGRISIAMLWETLRYETMLGAKPGEEPWRLNNSYRAYYSRWIMQVHDDLAGVFEIRESQAEHP